MSLPDLSVRRPITVLMATLAVTTFGLLAARRLPVELLPDLSYPTLTIQTVDPDAAPLSVEQFVSRPIEEAVGVIPGVREMRSISRAGLSEVILEFDWDEAMDFASIEVREKLGLAPLPREAEAPRVLRFDPSLDPIVRLAFSGDRGLDELRDLAERWIKPRLEAVRGVAAAKVRGGLDTEIQVEADEDRLAALGLTLDDLAAALRAENVNQPGGTLKDFHAVFLIRTLHEFQDLESIRRTVVRETPMGRVRVEDVAEVRRGHRDRDEITRSGGSEVVEIALHREGSANTVAVAEAIRKELDHLREGLADDLSLTVLTDQSGYISDAVGQVWSAAILGGILAILVIFFFLRDFSSTAILGLSIPVSVIATFLPMQRAGVSLNIMSLGGLALGVGMLVDNSIVVLEAIDRRRRQGDTRREAAVRGAGEVAGAVTASTLTTVCVFFPIVFVKGIAGQLFYDQAVTVCLSLLASLIVSLTLLPSLAAWGGSRRAMTAAGRAGGGAPRAGGGAGDGPSVPLRRVASLAGRIGRSTLAPWRWRARGASLPARVGGTLLAALGGTGWLIAAPPLALIALPFDALLHALAGPTAALHKLSGLDLPPLGDGRSTGSVAATVLTFPLRFGILLAASLTRSLWIAVTWVVHALLWLPARILESIGSAYPRVLAGALRFRWVVLLVAGGLFAASLAAIPLLGTNLVPDLSQGEFAFQIDFPEGTPLETTSSTVARIESMLAGDPRLEAVFSTIGSLPSSASGRRTLGENLAQIDVRLPPDARAAEESAAIERVRRVLARFPQVESELVRPSVLTVRPPVAIQVFAEDLDLLDTQALRIRDMLAALPVVEDVAMTSEPGSPEIRIELDRERAGSLGVSAEEVGRSLRQKIRGEIVGQIREGEERIDIRLRASERDRNRASEIEALRIRLPDGSTVPIGAIARVEVGRGPAAIYRASGARFAEVTAKVAATNLGEALRRVREDLHAAALPACVTAQLSGQDEELRVSFDSLKLALALAIFLVYVVMASQFESLVHPFVILAAVPLALVGIVGALGLAGYAVSVLVLIGAVMLAGIVVNNAIVLVDAINRRRREGQTRDDAIQGAGRERLRPILMTTLTTVLGLTPMALGLGPGDELRAPLAITVIGGLSAATLLTLLVTPCIYRVLTRDRPAATGAPPP